MTNEKALVEGVKADLEARGIYQVALEDGNRAPFEITARVAWKLRKKGARLFLKHAPQNRYAYNGVEYGIDAISFPDGWVDVLAKAGPPANQNRPAWLWHEHEEPRDDDELAEPFDLDAVNAPSEEPPPVEEPPADEPAELPPADPQTLADVALQLVTEVRGLRSDIQALNGTLLLLAKGSG